MTRRPASASSAAATKPARPAPTTMASASTPFPRRLMERMLGGYRQGKQIGATATEFRLQNVADLIPPHGLQGAAHVVDSRRDRGADARGDQRVFDRRRAALIGAETPGDSSQANQHFTSHRHCPS